ncbi:DNA-processing protein DprA [Microbacterium sp. NPDC089189]|uniref:DNA-processing protein DprA n=1 Tax=Microbacterium sp. NPDC089189 TaxID=3154972 RepID=UPI0034205F6E
MSEGTLRAIAQRLGSPADGERAARIAWSGVSEPGDRVAGALIRAYGPVEAYRLAFLDTDAAGIARRIETAPRTVAEARERWRPRASAPTTLDAVGAAQAIGAQIVIPGDAVWPTAFDDLGDHAPVCLWVRGHPEELGNPGIALVGARAASPYGEHVAGEIAAGVARAEVNVVSGAAYGIDGAAHRASLAEDGTTIAFLAGGCDRAYPAGHQDLLERILHRGAVASEVPCGSAPTKWRFLARNRLIAAASAATVVVEAGSRSGSLNTAGHAVSLGRPLGAVPGPVTSSSSAGTHRLLREYDAVCITDAAEALELAGMGPGALVPRSAGPRTDNVTRVRDALSVRRSRTVTEVAVQSGMSERDVEAVLGILLLDASVLRDDGGWRLAGSR